MLAFDLSVLVLLCSLFCVSQQSSNEARFLWPSQHLTTTGTVIETTTETLPSTVTALCLLTTDTLTACRRRRGIEEQAVLTNDDELQPTQTLSMEHTETVANADEELASETMLLSSKVLSGTNEDGMEEEITGRHASAFMMDLLVKTKLVTSTVTETVFMPITVATKTFTLGGCIPGGVDKFPACPQVTSIPGSDPTEVVVAAVMEVDSVEIHEPTTDFPEPKLE